MSGFQKFCFAAILSVAHKFSLLRRSKRCVFEANCFSFPRCACARALLFHPFLKTGNVDRQSALSRHELREIDRKTVRVVQGKDEVAPHDSFDFSIFRLTHMSNANATDSLLLISNLHVTRRLSTFWSHLKKERRAPIEHNNARI